MKRIIILGAAALAVSLAACHWARMRGNGQITTDRRTTAAFSEIEAHGAFQIEWRSGPPALSITTDENLLHYIENQNIGNRLELRSHESLWPTHGIKVAVSSPTLVGAKLTGATRLIANQITGEKFAVESTGAAKVTLDGAVDTLLADMTGASELKAGSLRAKTAEVSTTGAADADITVIDTLKVSITGAGKVNYWGNPPTIEKRVTGAGSIHHRE